MDIYGFSPETTIQMISDVPQINSSHRIRTWRWDPFSKNGGGCCKDGSVTWSPVKRETEKN